jgi:succinoglycan biosynthesis transport protein ExoP
MDSDLQIAPPPAARQATMREFLAVVFRRRWVVIGLFAATTATVLGIALSTPLEYMSVGRVLVKRGEKQSVMTPSRMVVGGWEEDLASELEVVRSFPVLQRAREFLKADSDTTGAPEVKITPRKVDTEVMGKSNVLAIGYVDRDPVVARRACDAVIRAYVEYRQKDLSLAFPRQFFDTELAKVKGELDRKIAERLQYQDDLQIVNINQQAGILLSKAGLLSDRAGETEAELAEARTARARMQELRTRQNVDLPTFNAVFTNESALIDIKSKVISQEVKVAELREVYREDSPDLVAAVSTLNTLREMLSREVDARLAMMDSRIQVLEARLAVFRRDAADVNAQLEDMPGVATRMETLERDITLLKTRYQDLLARSDQAKVTENTSVNLNLVLLSPPSRATPRNSRDYARLALAPAFSVVVGLGLAFFFDGLDTTVRTSGHAEEAVELPVLAAVRERRRGA